MHIALLGDSILDNRAYTRGEPDVVAHLRRVLPPSFQATLCAIDGSMTGDLVQQIARIPADASHLVVSIGGNDALQNIDLLATPGRARAHRLDCGWSGTLNSAASERMRFGRRTGQ